MSGDSLRLFWRVQWHLGALGLVDRDLLLHSLQNVVAILQGKQTKPVRVSKLRLRGEAGIHLATRDEIYESADIEYSLLPLCVKQHILERRIQKRVCWHCEKRSDKHCRICSACRLARYCSAGCQDASWRAHHKKACKILVEKQDTLKLDQFRSFCEVLESQHIVCTYAEAWKVIWANSLGKSHTSSGRLSRTFLLERLQKNSILAEPRKDTDRKAAAKI